MSYIKLFSEGGGVMSNNKNQSKGINGKWLVTVGVLLLFAIMLPSIFLLAKIAIGLIIIAIATISVKIFLKAISNAPEEKKTDQNQVAQQTTQSKIAVGLASISVLLLSAFTIVKVDLIAAACASAITLVLYDRLQDKEIGRDINNKFDEVADYITNFIASRVAGSKNCQV